MVTRRQLLGFWPDVLGIAALVLPFNYGVSPVRALGMGDLPIVLLAAALCLTIPIAIWQGLRALRTTVTKTERVLAYLLSVGAMLWPVILPMLFILESLWRNQPLNTAGARVVMLAVPAWVLVCANVWLLRRNLKAAVPAETSAGMFLVGGYLPNAVYCIILFPGHWNWDIGAYCVFAACIGYLLRIVYLMRRANQA